MKRKTKSIHHLTINLKRQIERTHRLYGMETSERTRKDNGKYLPACKSVKTMPNLTEIEKEWGRGHSQRWHMVLRRLVLRRLVVGVWSCVRM